MRSRGSNRRRWRDWVNPKRIGLVLSWKDLTGRELVTGELLLNQMQCVRSWLVQSVAHLSEPAMLSIPQRWRNNILWNLGHVITDQCNMIYTPCGLDSPLPASYNDFFDPGTSPADWPHTPVITEVVDNAVRLASQIEADARDGKFDSYVPLALDDGVVLREINAALSHCNLHEAMHLGVILRLRKLV